MPNFNEEQLHARADLMTDFGQYAEEIRNGSPMENSAAIDTEEVIEEVNYIVPTDILSIMQGTVVRMAKLNKETDGRFTGVVSALNSLQGRVAAILRQGTPGQWISSALQDLALNADLLASADMDPSLLASIVAASNDLKAVSQVKVTKSKDVAGLIRTATGRLAASRVAVVAEDELPDQQD